MKQSQSFRGYGLVLWISMMLLFGSVCIVSARSGQTWYVDASNTSGPWDGSLEHPFQHIGNATHVAQDGDTVFVFNGTYNEEVNITTSIQLLGENKHATIINQTETSQECGIVCAADNITISGFSICGCSGGYATAAIMLYGHTSHNIITDNIIFRNNFYGIYIQGSSGNTIANNLLMYNGYGIVQGGNSSHNLYQGNTLIDDYIDLEGDSSFTTVSDNTFERMGITVDGCINTILNHNILTNGTGISIYDVRNLTITRNQFFSAQGILFADSLKWDEVRVDNNTILNDPIVFWYNQAEKTVPSNAKEVILAACTNITVENLSATTTYGIKVFSSTNIQIRHNNLKNTSGINLAGSSQNTVANNSIWGPWAAITLGYCHDNLITSNVIRNAAIESYNSSRNNIAGNFFLKGPGLDLYEGTQNDVVSNQFEDCSRAIKLEGTHDNTLTNNNFLHNQVNVFLWAKSKDTVQNTWHHNYWSRHIPFIPKLIFGLQPGFLPCLNIDPNPAMKKNTIPYPTS